MQPPKRVISIQVNEHLLAPAQKLKPNTSTLEIINEALVYYVHDLRRQDMASLAGKITLGYTDQEEAESLE